MAGFRGGQSVDTVLYVINPAIGGTAKFDDDSGLRLLSRIPNNLDCTNITCWMVTGNYNYGSAGGTLAVWSQNAAVDADGDGISNSLEQSLASVGRLPAGADTKKDSDNDGLSDFVEMVGVPAASLAGGDSSLAMPWQGTIGGTNPAVEDLFIEVDWMQDTAPATAHSHQPYAALANDLATIFTNDQGWTGRNIRVHYELSQNVGHWDRISYVTCAAADVNFYTIKNNTAFFDPLRRLTHHYVIVGHLEKDGSCVSSNTSGRGEIFGNDLYVTLGTGNGTVDQQKGTHVHEMGHNLFLDHNANDDAAAGNRSCVHSSVMNYRYQFGGWTNAGNALRAFGYSNGTCLSGNVGGCANTCTNRCVTNGQVTPKVSCPLGTGVNAGKRVSNGSCDCDRTEWTAPGASPLANRVSLAFQGAGDAADGVPMDVTAREAMAEYQHGGYGERRSLSARHRAFGARKRARLEDQGLREGRDFWINPENGKVYSAN